MEEDVQMQPAEGTSRPSGSVDFLTTRTPGDRSASTSNLSLPSSSHPGSARQKLASLPPNTELVIKAIDIEHIIADEVQTHMERLSVNWTSQLQPILAERLEAQRAEILREMTATADTMTSRLDEMDDRMMGIDNGIQQELTAIGTRIEEVEALTGNQLHRNTLALEGVTEFLRSRSLLPPAAPMVPHLRQLTGPSPAIESSSARSLSRLNTPPLATSESQQTSPLGTGPLMGLPFWDVPPGPINFGTPGSMSSGEFENQLAEIAGPHSPSLAAVPAIPPTTLPGDTASPGAGVSTQDPQDLQRVSSTTGPQEQESGLQGPPSSIPESAPSAPTSPLLDAPADGLAIQPVPPASSTPADPPASSTPADPPASSTPAPSTPAIPHSVPPRELTPGPPVAVLSPTASTQQDEAENEQEKGNEDTEDQIMVCLVSS